MSGPSNCRDSIVVSTLRCGRNNPGSNPGHGTFFETILDWSQSFFDKNGGLVRDLNPGPLAPKARIIPLDQRASAKVWAPPFEISKLSIGEMRGNGNGIWQDEVAEWLRRWTANPMCSARVGSNPILVGTFFFAKKAVGDCVKGLVRDSNPGPLAP